MMHKNNLYLLNQPMCRLSASPPAVLILAAGLSQRMGRPKALLEWSPGITFLEKIIQTYTLAGCSPVLCTLNPATLPVCQVLKGISQATLIENPHPGKSRLYSIRLGLERLAAPAFCFIQNVDNPFITQETLTQLWDERDENAWISPQYQEQNGHPVLLPDRVIQAIRAQHDTGISLHDLLRNFPKKTVIVRDAGILKNINTPEAWEDFQKQSANPGPLNSSHQSVLPEC